MPAPAVGIYRDLLLPPSETFVTNQARALRRYRPLFLGMHVVPGQSAPTPNAVLQPGGSFGRVRELVFRRSGRAPRLERAARRAHVRLIHAHHGQSAVQALPVARTLGVPLVATFHGFDATATDATLRGIGPDYAALADGWGRLSAGAALIIAVSPFIRDTVVARGLQATKVVVHHIGVPVGPPPGLARPPEPVVLFVARLVAKKGLGHLVAAMEQVRIVLPEARLVVIGDGPQRADHEREASRRLPGTQFVGWQTPEQVRAWMRRAWVLAVPSVRSENGDAEGLGQVILEAGDVGLPTVGFRHGGIPEAVVDGRGGLLAEEGDEAGLARRLIAVLNDEPLRRRLGAGAREHVEREFDIVRQTARLEELYDDVCGRAAPPRPRGSLLAAAR